MNFKSKIALSIITIIGIFAIGTNVHAATFTSRILNETNVNLKSSGDVSFSARYNYKKL